MACAASQSPRSRQPGRPRPSVAHDPNVLMLPPWTGHGRGVVMAVLHLWSVGTSDGPRDCLLPSRATRAESRTTCSCPHPCCLAARAKAQHSRNWPWANARFRKALPSGMNPHCSDRLVGSLSLSPPFNPYDCPVLAPSSPRPHMF